MGLANLPKAKWRAGGRQPVLNQDLIDIEDAILESAGQGGGGVPYISWVDASAIRVKASSDLVASVVLSGFPNVFHPGGMVNAGLTDCAMRTNAENVDMDFDLPGNLWGGEKANQWYNIYATAGDTDATFTLKAMPFCRVSSQSAQAILLRNNHNSADIGYGFTTDALVGYKIYVITGVSKGAIRTIAANNNDNDAGGTITYSGDVLTLSQGDWFVILPATNFRWIGDILNNTNSNIWQFERRGTTFYWIQGIETGAQVGFSPVAVGLYDGYWFSPVWGTSALAGEIIGAAGARSAIGGTITVDPETHAANISGLTVDTDAIDTYSKFNTAAGVNVPIGWPLYGYHYGDSYVGQLDIELYNLANRAILSDGRIAMVSREWNGLYAIGFVYPLGYL